MRFKTEAGFGSFHAEIWYRLPGVFPAADSWRVRCSGGEGWQRCGRRRKAADKEPWRRIRGLRGDGVGGLGGRVCGFRLLHGHDNFGQVRKGRRTFLLRSLCWKGVGGITERRLHDVLRKATSFDALLLEKHVGIQAGNSRRYDVKPAEAGGGNASRRHYPPPRK
jgi:hypothetical protein